MTTVSTTRKPVDDEGQDDVEVERRAAADLVEDRRDARAELVRADEVAAMSANVTAKYRAIRGAIDTGLAAVLPAMIAIIIAN